MTALPAGDRPQGGLAGKRILIVDDQEDIRLLLRLALEPLGGELLAACNGREAIELAGRFRPDFVILDVMMPGGIDGYQVCLALRDDPASAQACIILLSARGQQGDIEAGKQAGADHYLLKPFSPLALCEVILRTQ